MVCLLALLAVQFLVSMPEQALQVEMPDCPAQEDDGPGPPQHGDRSGQRLRHGGPVKLELHQKLRDDDGSNDPRLSTKFTATPVSKNEIRQRKTSLPADVP